jgi:hypothetical protein
MTNLDFFLYISPLIRGAFGRVIFAGVRLMPRLTEEEIKRYRAEKYKYIAAE